MFKCPMFTEVFGPALINICVKKETVMRKESPRAVKLILLLAAAAAVALCFDIFLLAGDFGRSSGSAAPASVQTPAESVDTEAEVPAEAEHAEHVFENGVCALCGYVCPHSEHSPDSGQCLECGSLVGHTYLDLRCTQCGHEMEIVSQPIPIEMFDSDGSTGSRIVEISYETQNYYSPDGQTYVKKMCVYLPAGYSESRQYNVLLLLHGYGGDENYWFGEDGQWYSYPETGETPLVYPAIMLDNMIAQGICEPLIVVSPTYYLTDDERGWAESTARSVIQFRSELANDILPCLADTFSTYAAGSDHASLVAARDHFGFMGASFGSIIAVSAAMGFNFDLFGWYGFISGYETENWYLNELMSNAQWEGLSADLIYISTGDNDIMRTDTLTGRAALASMPHIDPERIIFSEQEDCIHEGRLWTNGLYNCAQLFFTNMS